MKYVDLEGERAALPRSRDTDNGNLLFDAPSYSGREGRNWWVQDESEMIHSWLIRSDT